jgi:AraC family transcriptional regulator of adaptative response/methylated-DNA-[protein]-cysteine methyltransferase
MSLVMERKGTTAAATTGAEIHFATGASDLGAVLVARSDKGACAIMLGDDPDALVTELRGQFPGARLTSGDPGCDRMLAKAAGLMEAPHGGLDLPLDVGGTAFQRRVWQALWAIPAGATASYAEVARRIGEPGAVRAVAQACAANRLALAIPCHRVVRSDGTLSGYRWGAGRKRALLAKEALA